jgi:hypothetical protein
VTLFKRIFAYANRPSAEGCADLMSLKLRDLKASATERGVDFAGINQTIKRNLPLRPTDSCL